MEFGDGSVLVYMVGSLGDTIVTVPSLRAVVRAVGDPGRVVVLHNAIPAGLAGPRDILPGSLGITRYVEYADRGVRGLVSLIARLRAEGVRSAVYLAPADRTEGQIRRDRVFFRLAGVRRFVGFSSAASTTRIQHEANRRLDRLERDGVAVDARQDLGAPLFRLDPKVSEDALAWLSARRRFPDRPVVVVCPGAKQAANLWPIDRFRELGRRLRDSGRVELCVVGGPAEAAVARELVADWGEGINAAGELSVLASAAILGEARLVIGLDTGTTHLAAAMGTPCLAIFGGREPVGRWEPIGDFHTVLRHAVACSPCGHRDCPVPGHPCMSGHRVDDVLDHALRMLDAHPGARS